MNAFRKKKKKKIETKTNGKEISWGCLYTTRILLNFQKRTLQPKPGREKSNGKEVPGKKFPKMWVYLSRLNPVTGIFH